MRDVLRERGFAALWLAQLISRIGDSIHEIALIWIVYEVTGEPQLIAIVALASFAPNLLFSIPAGVVVDRVDRKRLLVGAQLVRGLAVLAIPIVGTGPSLVPVVVAVALLASTMEAFFGPAQQATIPRLVAREDLDAANSLTDLTISTSRLFYAVGGVVVGVGGSFVAFYVNSATFLVAAVLLLAVPSDAGRPETTPSSPASRPSMVAEAREGVRFIRESPALLAVIGMGVVVDFAFVPLVVVLPVFSTVVLGGDSATYGFLLGAFSAGALVGNLAIDPIRDRIDERRGVCMVAATMVTGAGVGLMAWLPGASPFPLAIALGAIALSGAANPFLQVPLTTYTQSVVPDEMRGKVFSVLRLGITGAAPVGIALAGPLVDAVGPVAVLLGIGALIAMAGASGLVTPLVRIGSVAPPRTRRSSRQK